MKFVWEVTDIKPLDSCGGSMLGGIIENTKTNANNRFYLLGYTYVAGQSEQHIVVSSLDDGAVVALKPVDEIVRWLNDSKYAPVMKIERPERSGYGR